jgi:hypothetical protein
MLLFPRGKRPAIDVVREAVAQADRTEITYEAAGGELVELLRDGLTYDLVGLAPHPAVEYPAPRHSIGIEREIAAQDLEAVALQPGVHIAAGAHTMPVTRTLAGLAADLSPRLGALVGIGWPPAGTFIGPESFASTVSAWLGGGAFPALGLTAFAPDADGGLRSDGLAWFTGQEIALEAALCEDRARATRLAIRLVNQLVGRGAMTAPELIAGPDGERLLLEPVADSATVRVRRG